MNMLPNRAQARNAASKPYTVSNTPLPLLSMLLHLFIWNGTSSSSSSEGAAAAMEYTEQNKTQRIDICFVCFF